MSVTLQRLLVVGGNGFIGSAVCKAALARGMQVTSISSSGNPYRTAKGHSPAWTSQVTWLAADALHPSSYAHLLPQSTAVVHTLGTLFEDLRYKTALKEGDIGTFINSILRNVTGIGKGQGNPLGQRVDSYNRLNRDSALRVCEQFISSKPDPSLPSVSPRTFVYISAEDMLRPFISSRYIETKREAEHGIATLLSGRSDYRGVFVRPSFVYHAHLRPITSPLAALLDLSSTAHRKVPDTFPTPAGILRTLGSTFYSPSQRSQLDDVDSSALHAIARALTVPPIHVEHVAQAVCAVLQDTSISGVLGVKELRELIGWTDQKTRSAEKDETRV